MAGFAGMRTMDIWYARLSEEVLLSAVKNAARSLKRTEKNSTAKRLEKRAEKTDAKAHTHDSLQALSKLAERVDDQYRIVSQPPIVVPLRDLVGRLGISSEEMERIIHEQFRRLSGHLAG